jgi:hypothetical protein
MPFDLQVTHALQVQPSTRAQRTSVTPRRPRERVVARAGAKTRVASLLTRLCTAEERREGLVDPPQHILAGREVRHPHITVRTDRLQLVGLVEIADADAIQPPGRPPLVKRCVVQPACLVDLGVKRSSLGMGRIQPVREGSPHASNIHSTNSWAGLGGIRLPHKGASLLLPAMMALLLAGGALFVSGVRL